jgi:signal transduction histidine kinase
MDRGSGSGRRRPTIRSLSIALAVAIAVPTVGLVVSNLWAEARLSRLVSAAVAETRAAAQVNALRGDVLLFSRLHRIRALEESPELLATLGSLEQEIRAELDRQLETSLDPASAQVGAEAAQLVRVYLAQLHALEPREQADSLATRSSLDQALAAIGALREVRQERARAAQADADQAREDALYVTAAGGALLLLALLAIAIGSSKLLFSPLVELHRAIQKYRSGDRDVRASECGTHETAQVGFAFNDLVGSLRVQRDSQLAFLAGVAHDLRNPLTALKMALQRLAAGRLDHQSPIALLERQIDRMTRIVDDLLDATRIEAGQLELKVEDCDLRAVAREVIELYQPSSSLHQLTLRAPDRPVLVHVDPLRMEQVIGNLVSNAIKYSPLGGPVELNIDPGDRQAVLTVTDHGIGIPAERMQDLFTPFQRRDTATIPGAGLGLSVARRIIAAHGGAIEVDSSPGTGSTFRVRLARSQPSATEGRGLAPASPPPDAAP